MSVTSSDEDNSESLYGDSAPAENSTPAASFGAVRVGKPSSLDNATRSTFSYNSASITSTHIESLATPKVMERKGAAQPHRHHKSPFRSTIELPPQSSLAQYPSKESYLSASSVPTHEDLYEKRRRRPPSHRCNLHARPTHDSKKADQGTDPSHAQNLQRSQRTDEGAAAVKAKTAVETGSAGNAEFMEAKEDALLKRMQRKEKEFDAKIKEINQTFSSAGRQLIIRDDIIEALQREILELREQLDKHNVGNQQSREGEKRLMESIQNKTQKLQMAQSHSKLEKEQLRAELDEYKTRCMFQKSQIEQLRENLENSRRMAHDTKQHHAREIESLRKHFHNQIGEIGTQYSKMDREHAGMRERMYQAEKAQRHAQAKVLQTQLELRQNRDQEGEAMKSLLQDRSNLQEEVEAARLGIARLLSVLSYVPNMQEYLKWNELDSEFVFLAYPMKYFPTSSKNPCQTARDSEPAKDRIPRCNGAVDKDEDDYAKGYENSSEQPLSAETNPQTGVEDGIYIGSASFEKTKNIWLSGQWIKKLQEIIDSENVFTRLKKIKLLELEEAARLCNQLPTAQDVLQCRRQEKDYWVPYEVFIEAQQFKNKYCPRVPALSHFYPFLMKLNAIWNRKLQERVRVLRKELHTAQQQALLQWKNKQLTPQRLLALPISERYHRGGLHNGVTEIEGPVNLGEEGRVSPRDHWQQQRSRRYQRSSRSRSPRRVHCRALLLGASRSLHTLSHEHLRLRREVRLYITSPRSLGLFRCYDQLLRRAGGITQQLMRLCEQTDGEGWKWAHYASQTGVNSLSNASTASGQESLVDVPALPTAPCGPHEPRHGHNKQRRKGCDKERANDRESLETTELEQRPTALEASSVTILEQEALKKEEGIEQLSCIVRGTCRRVADITQTLFARTTACCVDLEKLMRMVQYKCIPKLYNREDGGGEGTVEMQEQKSITLRRILSKSGKRAAHVSSSSTTSSRSSCSSAGALGNPAPRDRLAQDIQQEFSGILRSHYAQKSAAARLFKRYGQPNEEDTDLQGSESARLRSGGPRGIEALSQVVASVLDFTSEVKHEIQITQDVLDTVLKQALSESETCQCNM